MDKKALSLPILTALVVGNIIGTGIYLLPASLAAYGTISLIAWVLTGIGALFLALTFTSLTKRYAKTGGPYAYCKVAFGKPIGFVVAYIYWMSYLVSIAAIAVASVGYLGFLSPALDANKVAYNHVAVLGIEVALVWLFTIINLIGLHTAGVVQLILTIIKISPLIIITLVGFNYLHIDNLMEFSLSHEPTFITLSSAAALTFWAFVGLEAATVPAENTRGVRDIYKATVYGTLLAAVIYIASTFVLMGMIPSTHLMHSQFPFAEAGIMLFGHAAAGIIAICAVLSGLGAMNACILVQGQIVFAAARDHMFPHAFAKLSKHDVPVMAHLLSSSIITLALMMTIEPTLLQQFNNIALLATLMTLITYFITTLSELKFLLQEKASIKKILLSKPMFIAAIAAAYSAWMISSFSIKMLCIAAGIMLISIPIYFLTVRKYTEPL